jgi:hypothetical protein
MAINWFLKKNPFISALYKLCVYYKMEPTSAIQGNNWWFSDDHKKYKKLWLNANNFEYLRLPEIRSWTCEGHIVFVLH